MNLAVKELSEDALLRVPTAFKEEPAQHFHTLKKITVWHPETMI